MAFQRLRLKAAQRVSHNRTHNRAKAPAEIRLRRGNASHFQFQRMQLTLSKSTIRSFQPSDAPSIAKHIGAYSVARNLNAVPHPYSLQHAEEWLATVRAHTPETHFAIVIDNQAVGGIGLNVGVPGRLAMSEHCAEIGYWLGELYWGRGIVSEAVVALTEWAFTELRLVRLHAAVYARNPASAHVLEKAGRYR